MADSIPYMAPIQWEMADSIPYLAPIFNFINLFSSYNSY
jgi:hypothetical protein